MNYKYYHLFIAVIIGAVIFLVKPERLYADDKISLSIPDSNHLQIVEFKDGSINMGRIVEILGDTVVFRTNYGEIRIHRNFIDKIKLVSKKNIKEGRYWFPNPNSTRLFFAPTARMLEKGDGYFSDYYLFFPGIAYGITDNITMGAGMSLIPGVEFSKQLFFLTPKVGIKAFEKFALAAGALIIRIPNGDDDDNINTVGILYGVSTYGTTDHSLTFGLGYGFENGNLADEPMVLVGGEARLTRRASLITENWIFPGLEDPLISYGVRFFGEKLSVDLALINILGEYAIFPGVPYIDFVVNF
ncbi:hypothetical protein ISS30_08160 [bacterium]|nr:hypothetical protein [FCB group bacterium]MBL7191657.1 hypothetical protein [bacterium]